MRRMEKIEVYADTRLVGTIAEYGKGRFAFEYSQEWLESGFAISPFSLPLEKKLFVPEQRDLDGLFGVFDDSLPDGWGRLLTDRYLITKGIDVNSLNPLFRLALQSELSSGLLEYRPRMESPRGIDANDFDSLFTDAKAILGGTAASREEIERLYRCGGSSGGARPKVNAVIDGDLWIVKFPASFDREGAGLREYECNKMAVDAGLNVAEFRLISSKTTKGFFASKRFDREKGHRIHMISLSGLLESSYRYPSLDYTHLLKATWILTKSEDEVCEAFRRACFNVFVGNQDDHGKNFAFLYDEVAQRWHLSPAFDLTRSSTYYGEHSTTVCGKGRNITEDDLRKLIEPFSVKERIRDEIMRDVKASIR